MVQATDPRKSDHLPIPRLDRASDRGVALEAQVRAVLVSDGSSRTMRTSNDTSDQVGQELALGESYPRDGSRRDHVARGMGCGTRSGPSPDRMLAHTNALLGSSLSHAALALA